MRRLAQLLLPAFLVGVTVTAHAQSETVTRLQCDGKFSDFSQGESLEFSVEGVVVRVKTDRMSITGSAGFDGDYKISSRPENGVSFVSITNSMYGGFLNRFSGALDLTASRDANRTGFKFLYIAKCTKANPLF